MKPNEQCASVSGVHHKPRRWRESIDRLGRDDPQAVQSARAQHYLSNHARIFAGGVVHLAVVMDTTAISTNAIDELGVIYTDDVVVQVLIGQLGLHTPRYVTVAVGLDCNVPTMAAMADDVDGAKRVVAKLEQNAKRYDGGLMFWEPLLGETKVCDEFAAWLAQRTATLIAVGGSA